VSTSDDNDDDDTTIAYSGLIVFSVGRIDWTSLSTHLYGVDRSMCSYKSYLRETVLMSSIYGS